MSGPRRLKYQLNQLAAAANIPVAMNIAIVRSAERLDYDTKRELSRKITEAVQNNSRFESVKATAVAWDEPNDWSKFTHIVLSVGLEYSKCHEKFLEWLDSLLADCRSRVFNPPEIIKWNMNKKYLKELKNKGIALPTSVFIEPKDDSRALKEIVLDLEEQAGRAVKSVVIKNMMDAGGHSVHLVHLESQPNGQAILDRAISSFQGGILVQEYQEAINSEGEWSIIFIDRKITHGMLKSPCSSGFKVQTRYGGSNKSVDLENIPADVLDMADNVMKTVQECKLPYARVDVVRTNDGTPALMELELFEPELYLYNEELVLKFIEALFWC